MNFSPYYTIFFITIFFNILIYLNPNYETYSTDFGLMMIQVEDIIKSNFKTFSIQYPSISIDKNFEFYPFTKPFLGKVGNLYYIDFPPFYPYLVAILKFFLDKFAYTILSSFASFFTLVLIFKFLKKLYVQSKFINLALIVYSFCTTIFTYNFFLHEYPLAVFIIFSSIYFCFNFILTEKYSNLVLFGLFSAFSLFFRLEMIFIIIASGISVLAISKSNFFKISFYSLIGFLPFFILLLSLNYYIHGHILGLRYVLTITDNPNILFSERILIIKELLFGSFRGLFVQSLFFLLIPILYFATNPSKEKKFLTILVSISFFAILFTSPNHGDHIAPRYLFGLYPISLILFFYLIEEFFEIYSSIFYKILFALILFYSSFHSFKNFIRVKNTFLELSKFHSSIRKIKSDVLILRSYAEGLNTQNIYLEKKILAATNEKKLKNLIKILNSQNLSYSILSFGVYAKDLEFIKNKNLIQEKSFYILE